MSRQFQGQLILVSAPSGTGKTSLVARLLADDPKLGLAISHTTRTPRPGERDGVNYHFVDEPTFDRMVADEAFLEHARVFGSLYGTATAAVEKELARAKDVILEIDWQGAQQIRLKQPHARSIFILPPSREALRARLEDRGEDSESVVERRTRGALQELSHYHEYEFLVINDEFETAVRELTSIIAGIRLTTSVVAAREAALIQSLLAKSAEF